MESFAVIDFETTGLSPRGGARATEVAAVIVNDGKIVSRYQSLMNSGVHVPEFISELTGITNKMIRKAPPARQVMIELCDFLGPLPLIAHNASFDKKFFENECRLAGVNLKTTFACSMLVARRVFPEAPDHKLVTLIRYLKIPQTGRFHRALSDAEMTAQLVLAIHTRLSEQYGLMSPSHELLRKIQRTKFSDVERTLRDINESDLERRERQGRESSSNKTVRPAAKKNSQQISPPSRPTSVSTNKLSATRPLLRGVLGRHIFWISVVSAVLFLVLAT